MSDTSAPETDFERLKSVIWEAEHNPQAKDLWRQANKVYEHLRQKSQTGVMVWKKPTLPHSALWSFLEAIQDERPRPDLKTYIKDACKKAGIDEEDLDVIALLQLLQMLLTIAPVIIQYSSADRFPAAPFDTPDEGAAGKETAAIQEPGSAAAEEPAVQPRATTVTHEHEPEPPDGVLPQTTSAEMPATTPLQEEDAQRSGEPAAPPSQEASESQEAPITSEAKVRPDSKPEQKPPKDPFLEKLVEESETLMDKIAASLAEQVFLEEQVIKLSHTLAEMRQQSQELFDRLATLPDAYVPKPFLMKIWRQLQTINDQYELQRQQIANGIIERIDVFVRSWKYNRPFAATESAALITADGVHEQEHASIQGWTTAVLDQLYISLLDMLHKTCGVVPIEVRIGQLYQQGGTDILAETHIPTNNQEEDRRIARVLQLGYKCTDGRIFRPAKVSFYRFTDAG